MYGRFTLNQSATALSQFFDVEPVPDLAAQYNIAPTQMLAKVLHKPKSIGVNFLVGERFKSTSARTTATQT
jgi:putative SOS response-associated peptidase YedK